MSLSEIIDSVFKLKGRESFADGSLQKIFFIIDCQRKLTPYLFDLHSTTLSLLAKQCFTVEEFASAYTPALRRLLKNTEEHLKEPTQELVAQIFFLTFEFLRITSFRLTPENYTIIVYKLETQLKKFIDQYFTAHKFNLYLRTYSSQNQISRLLNKKLLDICLISLSSFLIYKLS